MGDAPSQLEMLHASMPILVTRSDDLPGVWVARCLSIDLVTQGSSPQDAIAMGGEAVLLVVKDDLERGLDPLERPEADERYWVQAYAVMDNGKPLEGVDEERVLAAVAVLSVRVPKNTVPQHARPPQEEYESPPAEYVIPPAWMLPALDQLPNSQRAR